MIVSVNLRRMDAVQLRAELVAAGVVIGPVDQFQTPFRVAVDKLEIRVADGTDAQVVRQVWQAHQPGPERTAVAIKRDRVKALLDANDEESVRLRAAVKVLFASLVDTRAWCNRLADQLKSAGLPVTVEPMVNRTWQQALQAVAQLVDAEIPEEVKP